MHPCFSETAVSLTSATPAAAAPAAPTEMSAAQLAARSADYRARMGKAKILTKERVDLEKATNAYHVASVHMASAEKLIAKASDATGTRSGLNAASLKTQADGFKARMWKAKLLSKERVDLEKKANAYYRAAALVKQADAHKARVKAELAKAPAISDPVSSVHKREHVRPDAAPVAAAPADEGSSSGELIAAGVAAVAGIGGLLWWLGRRKKA